MEVGEVLEAIGIYLLIFLGKIVEVSLATVRIVLITKGERVKGVCIAFFEITIWIILASNVLSSISEDPLKAFVYAIGFVFGNYLGSLIEEKIAIGIITLNIITTYENSIVITDKLKELEIGYTLLEAQGQKEENKLIIAYMARKRKGEVLKELHSLEVKFFVSINESRNVHGGYGLKRSLNLK